ncbi:MAG TPA: F0F1 ATP synthase subunit delta [Acidimicrobiales bacterium]|nr:F0F1 ATP synthase subunit delta [Acidimicrobiales bacterium]
MHERVRGYTDAVLETAGSHVADLAGELESFLGLLASSGDLSAVLANPTIPVAVRRTIVHEVLQGRLSQVSVQLLSFAVQRGASADYIADTAGIAAAAVARRDGKVLLEGPVGRTAAGERLEGYATAVLAPLKERQLGRTEDDLFRFMRIVEGDNDLRTALTTMHLPLSAREGTVHDLLAPRASQEATRMATYAARTGRPRDYLLLLDGLVTRVSEEANRRVADVRTAAPMDDAESARLATALARIAGFPVEVRLTPQPDLLGGFVATIGDLLVDASLRHRLERTRDALLAPPITQVGGLGGPAAQ